MVCTYNGKCFPLCTVKNNCLAYFQDSLLSEKKKMQQCAECTTIYIRGGKNIYMHVSKNSKYI